MRKIFALLLILLLCGCIIKGGEHKIKISSEVTPSRVSLAERESLKIEVKVTNIGKQKEKISVEVGGTQGLKISMPKVTTFVLKPDESRIITFPAELTEDALPGDYVIDVKVSTESGDVVEDKAKVRVVEKKGLL
ncbi:MAG: hypothetical protein DRN95_01555 [Candidatus Hydrothermarchaeota archaeon]|nr:MAG: hypothetical protein DRN95_01555 [Candidatus Hydrothermarchaeota archaeon]